MNIVARYRARGITIYDTAQHGAITFVVTPDQGVMPPVRYRQRAKRLWHRTDSVSSP